MRLSCFTDDSPIKLKRFEQRWKKFSEVNEQIHQQKDEFVKVSHQNTT